MLQSLRTALQSVLGDTGDWDRLTSRASSETVAPGTSVRAVGEPVNDVLIVERGLFEVATPGEPLRWASPGAIIGLAASLSGALSHVAVTALRHGRLSRLPARALWDTGGDVRASVEAVARLAQLPDHDLLTLAPDPLIIMALLEGCDAATVDSITAHLETAVQALTGARLVRLAQTASNVGDLAEELATHETDATTVVYLVHGGDDARSALVVAHADRVLIFQPRGVLSASSVAYKAACDGSARRHTEIVYVRSEQEAPSKATRRLRLLPTVKRIHMLPAPSAKLLELLLTALRQGARECESLRDFEVFADLSAPDLAWIQDTLRWERVDGGSLLLRQGDPANDAWLIRAGRLEVVRQTSAGERHLSWIGPGAFVGETALLSGGRQLTSVRAVRDSTVARVDQPTISSLLERSVGFTRAVARLLARRAAGETTSGTRRARTFAIVPLADPGRVRDFVTLLAAACGAMGFDATVVDAARLNATLDPEASSTRRGDVGDAAIIGWLDQLERRHDAVILICQAAVDSWTRRAIRQSDHILLVADATSSPTLRPIEHELAALAVADSDGPRGANDRAERAFIGARHLVLLQPRGIVEASGTNGWLAERPQHAHHHVRSGDTRDIGSIARRLIGRAVALAFSGASSRAPAHLGVVRAMQDHDLPIDLLSGTSSGAGVAALVAIGLRGEEALAAAISIITGGSPRLSQFQPPITALTSGAAAKRALQAVFGDRRLEDQLIPAVLTAVDIRRHRAVHLTRGPIWKLVRASGSLPLLWPPVWHEGDLLVDGGIINHLPTEVFGDQADDGLVVASDLDEPAGSGAPAFEGALDYGTVLNSWKELGRRIRRSGTARPPGLVDILYHTMAIPSFQQLESLAALAARDNMCLLRPTIGSYGLFEVNAETGRALEAMSWEHARRELTRVAARWHSRLVGLADGVGSA
jgi:NTE family protein